MNEDLSASFADLLDPDFQDHVISAMKEWCNNYRYASGEAYADLILTDISRPLLAWIDKTQRERKPGNYSDIEAANELVVKAADIVYILKHKTRPLYPGHIAMLNDAWLQFQRSIAYHLHIKTRVLIADLPNVVTEEIQRRIAEEKRKREIKRNEALTRWRDAGVASSTKYDNSTKEEWLSIAKQILKKEPNIKSTRKLANRIEEEGKYPYGANESIRKDKNIKKIYNEHKLKNKIG